MTQSSDEKAAEEFCSNLPVNLSETVGEERRRIFIAGIEHGKEVGAREMASIFYLQFGYTGTVNDIETAMRLWKEMRNEK